jgi:monoamine oxidase
MFQPVGGMDQVWRAMLDYVEDAVVYNAPVERITNGKRGASVTWRQLGGAVTGRFDWVVSSVPFPVLGSMLLDGFSPGYRRAVAVPEFAAACKVGWQAERRWWEDDVEQIYGGISYTNDPIQQFWYPSTGHCSTGPATLTGAYAAYEAAEMLGRLPAGRRIARARRGGARIHAEVGDESLVPTVKAVTVAWHRVPYQAGGWCHWDPAEADHGLAFATLAEPDGRFIAIGDQISSYPGWQEGCLETVERALAWIDGDGADVAGAALEVVVPDSRALTVGDQPEGAIVYEEGEM